MKNPKPMGRPPKPACDLRDTILKIRLSIREYELLTQAAGGQALSTWARELLTAYRATPIDSVNK